MNFKKLSAVLTVLLIVFISFSCEKIKDEINKAAAFDVNTNLPDHYFQVDSIQSSTFKSTNEWEILTQFEGSVNLDSIFEANDLSSASVENGEFTSIGVSIVDPTEEMNLDFVSEMRVTIANNSNEEGLIVATTGTIPAGSTGVVFSLNNENIATFLNNDSFYIKLEGNMVGPVPVLFIPMVMTSGITFTVNPL
jgi:hypothetical protein